MNNQNYDDDLMTELLTPDIKTLIVYMIKLTYNIESETHPELYIEPSMILKYEHAINSLLVVNDFKLLTYHKGTFYNIYTYDVNITGVYMDGGKPEINFDYKLSYEKIGYSIKDTKMLCGKPVSSVVKYMKDFSVNHHNDKSFYSDYIATSPIIKLLNIAKNYCDFKVADNCIINDYIKIYNVMTVGQIFHYYNLTYLNINSLKKIDGRDDSTFVYTTSDIMNNFNERFNKFMNDIVAKYLIVSNGLYYFINNEGSTFRLPIIKPRINITIREYVSRAERRILRNLSNYDPSENYIVVNTTDALQLDYEELGIVVLSKLKRP